MIPSVDNTNYVVPNSFFLEKNVMNWNLSDDIIRVSVKVGVAYGSPVRKVEELLYKAVDEHESVLKDPHPLVLFGDFGDNSLNFEVLFWAQVRTLLERRMISSEVRFRIDDLFRKADVVIAFPQRDVHLDTLRPLQVELKSPSKEV